MSLLSDRRGFVSVQGVFAMAFLLGAIWYLVGLGDAIVFHETLQDASDSVAFAPSVMQARGMNVLALVNLVMSAILAVLVAVKIIQLLLLAANVIACAIPFNPYCPLLSSWQSPVSKFVKITDKAVSNVNRGLYASETALAKVMPVVGQAKSVAASHQFGSFVDGGFTAGLSLVPGDLDRGVGSLGGGAGGGGGTRWGLPVEDEEYKNLCLHASDRVEDVLFKPLKFLPGANVVVAPIQKLVGALVGQLVKSFPQYFCGGAAGGSGIGSLGGTFKDIAKKGAEKVASEVCKEAVATAAKGPVPGAASDQLGLSACSSGLTSSFSSVSAGSAIGSGNKQTSKRIHKPADIGSDYYASYGFVFSRYFEKHDVDANLGVISQGRVKPEDLQGQLDRLLSQTQFSKSEFYYDPRHAGTGSWTAGLGSNQAALRDEALLNMRWRARLRRFRPPSPGARSLLSGAGLGSILRSIPSAVPGMNPGAMITVILGRNPEQLATWLDQRVGQAASRSTGGVFH